jgi:hypothetical protein
LQGPVTPIPVKALNCHHSDDQAAVIDEIVGGISQDLTSVDRSEFSVAMEQEILRDKLSKLYYLQVIAYRDDFSRAGISEQENAMQNVRETRGIVQSRSPASASQQRDPSSGSNL